MKTALLTLALAAVAGAAVAQVPISGGMSTGPSTGAATLNNNTVTNGNTGIGSTGMSGASTSQNLADAPAQPLNGAARTAQKRIERDGYKSVQNLQQGSDGLWHGTAMRGNASVEVTVDHAGGVSAQ
jgi:hypothetical protein